MKWIKLADCLLTISLVFWIVYNTCFGFNLKAESELEKLFDQIFETGIWVSLLLYFVPLIHVYKKFIQSQESKLEK